MTRKQIIALLETNKLRPSIQRIGILEYLDKHRTHPKVDDIYAALHPIIPTISKTTVYNTLKLLVSHNLVQRLTIDEKNVCFDIDISEHAHFFCRKCGKIYDLFEQKPIITTMDPIVQGHYVEEKHLYYRGLCKKCRED